MISSMKNMGSVIISAAIILAGTFAYAAVRRSFLITDCNRGINILLMYAIVVLPFLYRSW